MKSILGLPSVVTPLLLGTGWFDRALGLERLSWFDGEAKLGWVYPLPAWVWVLIVIAALAGAGWSYNRLLGPRAMRIALAGLRALVLLLIVALLCGPELVRTDERVEPDLLIVLVDRSASLSIADTVDPVTGEPRSRDAALREALASSLPVFDAQSNQIDRRVVWLGFGGQAFALDPAAPEMAELPATAIRTAIDQSLQHAAGQPIAGIVLITDGRSPQPTGAQLVRRLQQQAVSVFAVPLGADVLPLDLAIASVDAPSQAFTGDIVPVTVRIQSLGQVSDDTLARGVDVRLVDPATGAVLDERRVTPDTLDEPIRLTGRADAVGEVAWRVEAEVVAESRELVTDNNARAVTVELIDRPIRVLYVEGYPRWEYRYLKNMLLREESIASSMLLLSADRAFAQEGDVPITRPPRDAEEMEQFDVIVLGDVPLDYFTPAQVQLMRDHVANNGAGLLWIGGERFTPDSYEGSPLADLLPMRRPGSVARAEPQPDHAMQPTPLAGTLSVLRLAGPESDEDDWPVGLPPLRWVQDITPLKPTADVLALDPNDTERPLVTRLRYGSGQSLYVATDETWRWRFGRGELYFEQFWIQLVRMLGRSRVQAEGTDRAQLIVSARRVGVGQTVVVELTTRDTALLERQLPKVDIVVTSVGGDGEPIDLLELRPAGAMETSGDQTQTPGRRMWSATWQPTVAGEMLLRVNDPALDDLNLTAAIEVIASDDELRQPAPDHERLVALAGQTDGRVVALEALAELPAMVPNRARMTPDDTREPLWHSPLALGALLVLLTLEWIGRKWIRLV